MHGFLNQAWVLEALGVPVNYSASSHAVGQAFDNTADFDRPGCSEAVSYLLDSGVKVHMVFGDRDFACSWIGGEAASLAIEYSGTEKFKNAGYAPIISTKGVGGFVRQYGNFSFSRVFQAGHEGKYICSYDIFKFSLCPRSVVPTRSLLQNIHARHVQQRHRHRSSTYF